MKVNTSKTAVLAISDAVSYIPEIYIVDNNGNELKSSDSKVRVLGFTFDGRPRL